MTEWITTPKVCERIGAQPQQSRRAIDALAREGRITCLRAGLARLVRAEDLPVIRAWIVERGWIAEAAGTR